MVGPYCENGLYFCIFCSICLHYSMYIEFNVFTFVDINTSEGFEFSDVSSAPAHYLYIICVCGIV